MQYNHASTTKTSNSNLYRISSISNQANIRNNLKNFKFRKEEKSMEEKPSSKVFYKSSNYFYNNGGYGTSNTRSPEYRDNFHFGRKRYNISNNSINSYNKNSNTSNMNTDCENSYIKCMPKSKNSQYNYSEYSNLSSQMKKNSRHNKNISQSNQNSESENNNDKNMEYYEDNINIDNIGDSENNYNEKEYYENENENENENIEYENNIIIKKSRSPPIYKSNRWFSNNNYYSKSKTDQSARKKNISNDKLIKVRTIKKNIQNFGNNTTTTNNNYNNNIYIINQNPINIKKKNSNPISVHKYKKKNNEKKRSLEYTYHKKERDYFKMNNIDKSQRDLYISSAILIQSIFRGHSIKLKFYNFLYFHMCIQNGVEILEAVFYRIKKNYWKNYKNNISKKISEKNSSNKTPYTTSLKFKSKFKTNFYPELMSNSYYKDIHNSYYTVNDIVKTENNESDLKSKMNAIIEENNQLKIQLFDYKNCEEKLKRLTEENAKYQNINEVIIKRNEFLENKLNEISNYKKRNLVIENQSYFSVNRADDVKKNEMYLFKLKKFMAAKLIYKKMNNNNSFEEQINKLRNLTKKEMYLKSLDNIIQKHNKLKINKYFWKLYKFSRLQQEKKIYQIFIDDKLRKIIYNKERTNKEILRNYFFKFFINALKSDNEQLKNTINEEKKIDESAKFEKLKKIFNNYEKNVRLIYKVILEKWNLKSVIIGIKESARDKKKRRKQKKKINKLLYNKYYNTAGKNITTNNIDSKFNELLKNFSSECATTNSNKESYSNNECGKILEDNTNKILNKTSNNYSTEETIRENARNIRNKYKNLNRRYTSSKDDI